MNERSRRAASVLAALGVRAGDRVAQVCSNTPGFVDVLLGAWRLGAVAVPVNHKLAPPEIEYILKHSWPGTSDSHVTCPHSIPM